MTWLLSFVYMLTSSTKDVLCAVNVQHDCQRGACVMNDGRAVFQEREVTKIRRTNIKHLDDRHYVVNTSSLHNYESIQQSLPVSLFPPSFPMNSAEIRSRASAQLWDKKRQKQVEKELKEQQAVMGLGSATQTMPAAEDDDVHVRIAEDGLVAADIHSAQVLVPPESSRSAAMSNEQCPRPVFEKQSGPQNASRRKGKGKAQEEVSNTEQGKETGSSRTRKRKNDTEGQGAEPGPSKPKRRNVSTATNPESAESSQSLPGDTTKPAKAKSLSQTLAKQEAAARSKKEKEAVISSLRDILMQ